MDEQEARALFKLCTKRFRSMCVHAAPGPDDSAFKASTLLEPFKRNNYDVQSYRDMNDELRFRLVNKSGVILSFD